MRIMINEPDGRVSGISVGEAFGIFYGDYFNFSGLQGKTGSETTVGIREALEGLSAREDNDDERNLLNKMATILSSLLDLAETNPAGRWRVT
ncbi:MAG: hypothetical protein HY779_06300 [Rubrobacteridae bacterium]|nr:hypothetical protein [Rubrobacteridae bacterium]